MSDERLNLADLKAKSPADLLSMAEEWEIENASTMRKGEMMFSLLKEHAEEGFDIGGDGVLEVVQDGFGFLRSPEANYLPGPDDIYVSPAQVRRFGLRTVINLRGERGTCVRLWRWPGAGECCSGAEQVQFCAGSVPLQPQQLHPLLRLLQPLLGLLARDVEREVQLVQMAQVHSFGVITRSRTRNTARALGSSANGLSTPSKRPAPR